MRVTIRLHQTSDPFVFDALNAYTKGPLYCMRLSDGSTLKFPLTHVFSIREESTYSSQSARDVEKSDDE